MLSEVVRLVWGAGSVVVGAFSEKSKSEEIYRYVVPELQHALKSGTQMTSPDVVKAINILEGLPPVGARRRNFSRRYLARKIDILMLPTDPDNLAIGYWW
ncbi:hypothetical protein [Photobacterium profundum]|jgi:hypothetical protein|uniref:Uncharacterized protein n=1 Tax=Photobacterium profundum (strain SS9) TaxID=298386 RepID=Q6LHG2_PHOPR|nr:hypothetical protein [Photobacterium profundum]CAG23268.1 hypothetical protein PBPRB1401 [Photobacterium profundum SS9]